MDKKFGRQWLPTVFLLHSSYFPLKNLTGYFFQTGAWILPWPPSSREVYFSL